MRFIFILFLLITVSCTNRSKSKKPETNIERTENFIAVLDTIWETEQTPIRLRDSLLRIYGVASKQYKEQQLIYEKNHIINEKKIRTILDNYGWPTKEMIGEQGNWTICNVIQHADNEIRIKYLPMMRTAVKDKKLEPRFLVRAEDRIATEKGDLQIYGGQMKYYPETKKFNVWPVFDPVNLDKRRAAMGLEPIAEFLKNRFDFVWNLEEQIKRSEKFEKERLLKKQITKCQKLIKIVLNLNKFIGQTFN